MEKKHLNACVLYALLPVTCRFIRLAESLIQAEPMQNLTFGSDTVNGGHNTRDTARHLADDCQILGRKSTE